MFGVVQVINHFRIHWRWGIIYRGSMIMSRNEVWNRITGRIVLNTSTRTVLVKVYLRRSSILREFCGMGVANLA